MLQPKKPAFDPTKPFEPGQENQQPVSKKPAFDPSKPYEAIDNTSQNKEDKPSATNKPKAKPDFRLPEGFATKLPSNADKIAEDIYKAPTKSEIYKKQKVAELSAAVKNSTQFTLEDESKIQERVKTEESNGGFWGGIKQGAIQSLNRTIDFVGRMADISEEDTKSWKIPERKPFEEQVKQVRAEALKRKEKLTPEKEIELAKELFIQKEKENILIDKLNSFADNLDQSDKRILELDRYEKATHLKEENKKLLKYTKALEVAAKPDIERYSELKKQVADLMKSKQPITRDLIEEITLVEERLNNSFQKISSNYDKLRTNDKDLGTAEQEYDIFKRENRDMVNFLKNIGVSSGEILVGLGDFGGYVYDNLGIDFNEDKSKMTVDKYLAKTAEKLKSQRDYLRNPVESVESVEGFLNYVGDLIANQAPILALTATGTSGMTAIGASSTGQKYREMKNEVQQGKESYSPWQMATAPFVYGASEVVSEIPTLSILKKGARVFKAASKNGGSELISKSFSESLKNATKDYLKDTSKELAGEEFTQLAQNFTDKFILGKSEVGLLDGTGDVFKDTLTLTTILKASPHVGGAIARQFQSKDQFKVIENNGFKILELAKSLDNQSLTTGEIMAIQKKIDSLTEQSAEIMNKTVSRIGNMSAEQYNEIVRLNSESSKLKQQAKDIQINSNLQNKQELIDTLNEEYKKIQNRRESILNGAISTVEVLPESEQNTLRKQALEDLVTEKNPEGKPGIEFTEAEILNRANQIYSESKANEAAITEPTQTNTKSKVENKSENSQEIDRLKEELSSFELKPIQADMSDSEYQQLIDDNKQKKQEIQSKIAELENESAQQENAGVADENVQSRIDALEQNPVAEQQNNTEQSNEVPNDSGNDGETAISKNTVVEINDGKGDFVVELDEDGNAVSITSKKTGKPISKLNNTKSGGKAKNANFSRLAAIAENRLTDNAINKAEKKKFNDARQDFVVTNEYEAALEALANGAKVSLESLQKEVGNKDSIWASDKFLKEKQPSIEVLSERIHSNYPDLSQPEIRNALIDIISSFGNIEDVRSSLIESTTTATEKRQKDELFYFMSQLSEKDRTLVESTMEEDAFFEGMSYDEIVLFYEKQYGTEQERLQAEQQDQLEGPKQSNGESEGSNSSAQEREGEGESENQEINPILENQKNKVKNFVVIQDRHNTSLKIEDIQPGFVLHRGTFSEGNNEGFNSIDADNGYGKNGGFLISSVIKKGAKILKLVKGDFLEYEDNENGINEFYKIIGEKERDIESDWGYGNELSDITTRLWDNNKAVNKLKKAGIDIVIGNTIDGVDAFIVNKNAVEIIKSVKNEDESKKSDNRFDLWEQNNPVQKVVGSFTEDSLADDMIKYLDNLYNDLDKFGKGHLTSTIGMPIQLAKLVLKTMKLAVVSGKKFSEIIESGLNIIKKSEWYKLLNKKNKTNLEVDFLNYLKPNISFFTKELSDIGTIEEYNNYLTSIFPNSLVKKILFHGTNINNINHSFGEISYFTNNINYAKNFNGLNNKVIAVIVDIKNPYVSQFPLADVPYEVHITDEFTSPRVIKLQKNEYDSVIGKDSGQKEGKTYVTFNKNQIHKLGDKKDVLMFKEWKKNNDYYTLNSLQNWLNNIDKELDEFSKESLSMGIPIVVAKAVIQAMKLAVQAGKSFAQAIQAGIDELRNSSWYQSLTSEEQTKAENDIVDLLANGDRATKNQIYRLVQQNITEDEAYDKFKSTAQEQRELLENKKTLKEWSKKVYAKFVKRFSDRQYDIKRLLSSEEFKKTESLLVNSHGASGYANKLFESAYDKIYRGLNQKTRNLLDEIIQARRFITIDKNRSQRGLEPVTNPNFIDGNVSQKFLDKLKDEIGEETFNDLNKRANEYFKTYSQILDQMFEEGFLTQEQYDSMNGLDYQPRVFLNFITDFNGDLAETKSENNIDSGGLSQDVVKSMKEGDDSALVLNSQWLLMNSLAARQKAIANNRVNKKFITEEFPAAKQKFEGIDPNNFKNAEEERFYNYFKELSEKVIENPVTGLTDSGNLKFKYSKTPQNFAKMYYWEDGQRKEFFLEQELHDAWNDNVKGFLKPGYKEAISYASGAALVKAIATGNNPAFPIVNTPRDFFFTLAFSDQYSSFVGKGMVQITKDVIQAIKEIKKGENSDVMKKYFEYGGAMDFLSTQGTLKKDSFIGKAIDKAVDPKAKDLLKSIFKTISLNQISQYSELMFRLGLFQRSIKNQLDDLNISDISEVKDKETLDSIYSQAVADARGILDFNQGGAITKDLEAFIPYVNVAFQGGKTAVKSFRKNPVVTSSKILQIASIASGIPVGLSLMLIGLNKDDEDDRTAVEFYIDAYKGVSKYKKNKYMIIFDGTRNEDGEYRYWQIAKAQELSPVITFTDNVALNYMRSISGQEKKSQSDILKEVLGNFNDHVMPIDVTSPGGFFTRVPILKATLTYATGYDFFREEPLSMKLENKPAPWEGMEMKNVEEFYKKAGEKFGVSPVRSKAAVESFITTPETNPFIGMLYGGADVLATDKDAQGVGKKFAENIGKSVEKRIVGHTSEFNRQLEASKSLEEKLDKIKLEDAINNKKFKEIATQYANKEITDEEFKEKTKNLDPIDQKRLRNKIKDKIRLKDVEGAVLDIKYEKSAEARAVMILHYYGDIFAEENREILIQMKKAGGILTPAVRLELEKQKQELMKSKKPE